MKKEIKESAAQKRARAYALSLGQLATGIQGIKFSQKRLREARIITDIDKAILDVAILDINSVIESLKFSWAQQRVTQAALTVDENRGN